ncbi:MAG: hypothetical protein ABJA57_01925 [Ginsengibacter sp.]
MFEAENICPYTGLRSFTEDESLYFKGREDDIDQATHQLQRNKFLMLTGASGDGKSSLIYAGIIPNARSGFLKSKYSQWCVADFRPERTPFQNLCNSIARELDIANSFTVQSELNHGFSAIVDLYRSSKRYVDTNSVEWRAANDAGKAAIKRAAANLIILVDQFEEFFTNPENYQQGGPSKDANLVLNLLLETARIAQEEELPIYVIFTMRSDYIGQCAAFRGLPEYIGFSQFFVPRLNRTQLQQVIEEPAVLSGNRITRRLTERLIHDLTEGVDQLPILQHALNQVWMAADHGNEEMDLIHYAMVGGMSVNEIPAEQAERFNDWFTLQAPEIKACYHAPSLQNVLDTHCNKLYEQAAGYYHIKTGKTISDAEAKSIIRTAFTCLTKIDQSRAVRNRMTLNEITNIYGKPALDTTTIGAVLNIFREPGNTFIHPFISDENPGTQNLLPSQVLDITHESLIRNWQYLGRWAKEEFESYSVSLDFEQQLGRWVNSNKSKAFLLSIGPLTYFESWHKKANPNTWWIARYLPEESTPDLKLKKASEVLHNSNEFLSTSAGKHAITRTLIKYGTKRIAAMLGIVALIALMSFAISDHYKKQNNYVLDSIHQQVLHLAGNPKVSLANKVSLICEELKSGGTTVAEVINSIKDTVQKLDVANGIAALLIFQGRGTPLTELLNSFSEVDSLLDKSGIPVNNISKLSLTLKEINDFRVNLEFAYYYHPDPQIAKFRNRNALRSAKWVNTILTNQPVNFVDVEDFSLALENALNNKAFTEAEVNNLLSQLSPFENGLQSSWLQSNFYKDKLAVRGTLDYGFSFNGLYQELAYLYAAAGNSEKALQCVDTLLLYNQNYFQNDYASGSDNASNIASVFFRNGKTEEVNSFVKGYCLRKKISPDVFYARLLGATLPANLTASNLDLYWWTDTKNNVNLQLSGWPQLSFFYNQYRETVQSTITDNDQKNFLLAVSFKNEGISMSLNHEKSGKDELSITGYFDQALSYYRLVSQPYLEQPLTVIENGGSEELVVQRKYLFIYPDLKLGFHPFEPRSYFYSYFTDVFLEYIIQHQLFDTFYPGQKELSYLSIWLNDYNTKSFVPSAFLAKKARYEVLKLLDQEIERRNVSQEFELNYLYLYLGLEAQQKGDTNAMLHFYNKIETGKIFNLLRTKEFDGQINNQSFRMLAHTVEGYYKTGHFDQALRIISMFKNPINRSSLYAFVASSMVQEKSDSKLIQRFIDSSRLEMNRAENITQGQPNRQSLAYAMVMYSPSKNNGEAYTLIKNIQGKFNAIRQICRTYGYYGALYNAMENIPPFISDDDLASFLWNILFGYQLRDPGQKKEWSEFNRYYVPFFTQFISYVDENS